MALGIIGPVIMPESNPYSYDSLTKGSPLDVHAFPQRSWVELTDGIDEDVYPLLVSNIAKELDLYWPKNGTVFTSLTVGDCLVPTLDSLLGMASMGKKKAITIVQMLTYLVENPKEFTKTKPEASDISLYTLLDKNPNNWREIAIEHWAYIRKNIPADQYDKKIERFAYDLGLKWPQRNWGLWTVRDSLTDSFHNLARKRGIGKSKLETIVRILIYLCAPTETNSPENTKDELFSHPVILALKKRERDIFEKRLLTVYEKPTLEELGQEYNVTRERIRQVEREIKKKIAASGLKKKLKELLGAYVKCELLTPYSDRRYLLRSEVPSIATTLSSELVLAIALSYNNIYQLLSAVAKEAPSGWYIGKRSKYNKVAKKLKRELEGYLPAPTESLANKLDLETKELIAVSLLNRIATPEGVLMLPLKTGRADANRAAKCFETAISNDRRLWFIEDLIEKSSRNSSPQNQRLYKISISRCPRLFISTPAYVSQLDHSIQIVATTNNPDQPLDVDKEYAETDDNGNFGVLRQLLEREWPITSTNIRELTRQAPYLTSLADNSLLVSLYSIPGCKRLAPGVYGPKDYIDHPTKIKKARKLTMDAGDIRAFCFARRSGEKCEEIFPLWDAHQEQLWFRKIQKKSEDDPLLRSFISIANQKKWPEQIETETLKLMEHTVSAKFVIEPSWINNRSHNVPDLAATLTALRYAQDIAPLSWIRANHITCTWQLAEESGVSVLICGLALGLLDATRCPWWKPIPASRDFDANWQRIQSLYLEKDMPDWNHPVIQKYFEQARVLAANKKLGFVKSDSLDQFIEKIRFKSE